MEGNMDKNFLMKRIEERATKRFEDDYNDFENTIYRHPIFKELKVTVGGEKEEEIPLTNFGQNYGLFNQEMHKNKNGDKYTNFEYVKDKVIEKYIQEETDAILNKLGQIEYLYE